MWAKTKLYGGLLVQNVGMWWEKRTAPDSVLKDLHIDVVCRNGADNIAIQRLGGTAVIKAFLDMWSQFERQQFYLTWDEFMSLESPDSGQPFFALPDEVLYLEVVIAWKDTAGERYLIRYDSKSAPGIIWPPYPTTKKMTFQVPRRIIKATVSSREEAAEEMDVLPQLLQWSGPRHTFYGDVKLPSGESLKVNLGAVLFGLDIVKWRYLTIEDSEGTKQVVDRKASLFIFWPPLKE